jgi:hypothetical protein
MIRRHPLRGLFGGLLLGLGLSLILVMLAVPVFGQWTVIVFTLGLAVIGVILAYVLPARRSGT